MYTKLLSNWPQLVTLTGFTLKDGWIVPFKATRKITLYHFNGVFLDERDGTSHYGTFLLKGHSRGFSLSHSSGDWSRFLVNSRTDQYPHLAIRRKDSVVSFLGSTGIFGLVQVEDRGTKEGWVEPVVTTRKGLVWHFEEGSPPLKNSFITEEENPHITGLAGNCAFGFEEEVTNTYLLYTLFLKKNRVDLGGLRLARFNRLLGIWEAWMGSYWQEYTANTLPPKIVEKGAFGTIHYNLYLRRFILVCNSDYLPNGPLIRLYSSQPCDDTSEALVEAEWEDKGTLSTPKGSLYPVIYNWEGDDYRKAGSRTWLFYTAPANSFRDQMFPTWVRRRLNFQLVEPV